MNTTNQTATKATSPKTVYEMPVAANYPTVSQLEMHQYSPLENSMPSPTTDTYGTPNVAPLEFNVSNLQQHQPTQLEFGSYSQSSPLASPMSFNEPSSSSPRVAQIDNQSFSYGVAQVAKANYGDEFSSTVPQVFDEGLDGNQSNILETPITEHTSAIDIGPTPHRGASV